MYFDVKVGELYVGEVWGGRGRGHSAGHVQLPGHRLLQRAPRPQHPARGRAGALARLLAASLQ